MSSLPPNASARSIIAAVSALEDGAGAAAEASIAAAANHGTIAGTNVLLGNSTGTLAARGTGVVLGQVGGTLGFYGAAGAAKPSAYVQTYSTAARTVPAATAVAVDTTAATSTLPFGYTEAQANAIPVAINAVAADLLALKQVVNALIDDAQAVGLV